MLLTVGKFTIDRRTLVELSSDNLKTLIDINAKKDIEIGGEFVITAEDLLEFIVKIPSNKLNEPVPEGYTEVHHSIIKITYKQL